LNIRAAHWANHVRPQRWAKNPPGKKERKTEACQLSDTQYACNAKYDTKTIMQSTIRCTG